MRGGGGDSPSMVSMPASTSFNLMPGDDSFSDDVFEDPDDRNAVSTSTLTYIPPVAAPPQVGLYSQRNLERLGEAAIMASPSPTGYRDYVPPAEVIDAYGPQAHAQEDRAKLVDAVWSSFRKAYDNPDNFVHKTILLGDSGVGKTSLLVQFDQKKFQHGNFAATVGIGFTNKMVTVDDSQVKLQIWDTAGQERFRSVTHAYYRDAHALLLLYDVTNKQSYDNIRAWLGEIREYAQDDVVIMLLGNKCDCSSERVVRKEEGQRLSNEYKVPFMETSAKTGLNVELAFQAVARELKAKSNKEINPDEERFNVLDYLEQHQSPQQRDSSCFHTNCLTT
ncbi:ras-related protein Rab-37 isoform X1 [Phymastichus coffea]|uniref:ras-related protein Rab-37 isoform X1 n=1 Tax=Phymastichus coffea TaxID=108790 RepID=UPI00273C2324|nr:ras-related protein Rab-37 isoform X1 [Phymastichus coffea]